MLQVSGCLHTALALLLECRRSSAIMEVNQTMSHIDTDMVNELLDALDMVMPDAESQPSVSSFQDVLQATFQWTNDEADTNMHIMFPSWDNHALSKANNPCHASLVQHEQHQQALPNNSRSVSITQAAQATTLHLIDDVGSRAAATPAAAATAAKNSPFAGLDMSSIMQQSSPLNPPIPGAAPPAAEVAFSTPLPAAAAAVHVADPEPALPAAAAIDCGSEQEVHTNQQQQQRGKRGRPQKIQGKYSKGYSSILKYRQRKKDMVSQMEQEVADKLTQLQQLQQQQQRLLAKETMLERSMGAQEALLARMADLRMSVGPEDEHRLQQVDVLIKPHHHQQQQQIIKVTVPNALPEVLQRYQQYIQAATAALAANRSPACQLKQTSEKCSSSSSAGGNSFPAFPCNIVDTLALWRISRVAGVPGTAAAAAAKDNSSSSRSGVASTAGATAVHASLEGALDDRTLNLATWLHDTVPADKWRQIAQQLNVQPHQKQQLAAAWQLYVVAVNKLNNERQQLLQQLQKLLQPGSRDMPGAAAAEQGSPYTQPAVVAGCLCTPLSGDDLQGYTNIANAIEWNLIRGRAMVVLFGWSMMCVLSSEQVGILCVGAWPHFPLVRAVVGQVLASDTPTSS